VNAKRRGEQRADAFGLVHLTSAREDRRARHVLSNHGLLQSQILFARVHDLAPLVLARDASRRNDAPRLRLAVATPDRVSVSRDESAAEIEHGGLHRFERRRAEHYARCFDEQSQTSFELLLACERVLSRLPRTALAL
jgi:hypothetical protein